MKNYKRLLQYMRPYTRRFILAVFCIVMAAGANLYLPWIIKDMVDKVLTEKDMFMLNVNIDRSNCSILGISRKTY